MGAMPMLPTWPGQPMPMKQMTMGFFMRSLTQLVFRYEQSIQPTESEQGVSGLVMSKPASACEADGWAKVADPRQKICALTRSPDVRLHVLTHGAHQGRLFPCALAYVHMSRHTDVYGPGVQLAWVEGW